MRREVEILTELESMKPTTRLVVLGIESGGSFTERGPKFRYTDKQKARRVELIKELRSLK